MAIVQGPMGLRTWLSEVQYLMGKLKQRSFSGMPLWVTPLGNSPSHCAPRNIGATDQTRNPRERQILTWYSAQWRQLRGGAVSPHIHSNMNQAHEVEGRVLIDDSAIWAVQKRKS